MVGRRLLIIIKMSKHFFVEREIYEDKHPALPPYALLISFAKNHIRLVASSSVLVIKCSSDERGAGCCCCLLLTFQMGFHH